MWIRVRFLALMLTGQLSIKYHVAQMVRKGYQPYQPSAQDKVVLFSSQPAAKTSFFHSTIDSRPQPCHWKHKTNLERFFLSLFWDGAQSTPFKAPDRYVWLSAILERISVSSKRLSSQWFKLPYASGLLHRITGVGWGLQRYWCSGLIPEILIQ